MVTLHRQVRCPLGAPLSLAGALAPDALPWLRSCMDVTFFCRLENIYAIGYLEQFLPFPIDSTLRQVMGQNVALVISIGTCNSEQSPVGLIIS